MNNSVDTFIIPSAYRPLIPAPLRHGLELYFNDRIETGGFLRAVLENDLQGAISRMNPRDMDVLWSILQLLCEAAPSGAWGTSQRVMTWLREGREQLTRELEAEESGRRG